MAFRYINPGYVYLLDSNISGATQIVDETQSRTGVGFHEVYNNQGVTLLDFKEGDEIWGRFDFYVKEPQGTLEIYCYLPNTNSRGFFISYPYSSTSTVSIQHRYDNTWITLVSGLFEIVGFKFGEINSVAFHAKLGDSSTAKLEIFIGENKFVSTGRPMAYSDSYSKRFVLCCSNPAVTFSNIILSDKEVSLKERAIALPISSTETNMTDSGNGFYIADDANQTLLQSPNVSELIATYGEASQITGIQVVGNPAFKTAEGLATLKSLSKAGGVVTEHNSLALSDSQNAVVKDGWSVDGTTVSDLQNMQFGWKVGE